MTDYQASPDAGRHGGARHRADQRPAEPADGGANIIRREHHDPAHADTVVMRVAVPGVNERAVPGVNERALEMLDRRLTDLHARERRVLELERHVQMLEKRAKLAAGEAARAESRLAAMVARETALREAAVRAAPPPRTSSQGAARDHELARMKAKMMDGETAGADLAERLRYAHLQAGKLNLDVLGEAVGYSKATLSKVFNNKMPPTWVLVRKLAAEFRVPPAVLNQEWLPLWIAASDTHRQKGRAAPPETSGAPPAGTATGADDATGHICPKCGAWVVDIARHAGWHMTMEPGGDAPDEESMSESWNRRSHEFHLLREALGGSSKK